MSRLFAIILLLYHAKCIQSEGNICCYERTIRDRCSSELKDKINLNCSDGKMFSLPLDNLQINETSLIVNGMEYNTSRYVNLIFICTSELQTLTQPEPLSNVLKMNTVREHSQPLSRMDFPLIPYPFPTHFRYCLQELDPKDGTPITVEAVLCIPHEHLMHAAELEPEPDTLLDANIYSIMIFITLDVASLALLIATIVIYWILPEIRDLQGSCVLHFLTNYCLTYIIFGTITVRIPLPCFVRAYGCIFFTFASFFWLTVSSFHVWSTSMQVTLGITPPYRDGPSHPPKN